MTMIAAIALAVVALVYLLRRRDDALSEAWRLEQRRRDTTRGTDYPINIQWPISRGE